jgi:hypothetical protein
MADIKEYERTILTSDMPEKDLVAGDLVAGDAGTVVSVHHSEDGERVAGYTLEFFSLSGETIALAAVGAARPTGPSGVT